jgi:hypothetical protein
MTLNVQNPDGTTTPASSQQLATVRADLGVPTAAEVSAVVDASAAAVLAQVPNLAAAVVPAVASTQEAAAGTDDTKLMTPAKVAAAIAALAPAGGGSGGVPATSPAGTSLVLDSTLRQYQPLTVSGATTLTVSGSTLGAAATITLIANGSNVPTVIGADEWATSFGYKNTAGVRNRFDAWHDGDGARFQWSQAIVAAAPVTPVLPGAPASFTAGAVGTTTQTLNWTAPTTGSPAVYTYSIAYRVNGSGSFPSPQLTGLTGLTTTVTGLAPDTPYDYQITATNTTGTGTAATLLNQSTSATLALPGNVVSLAAGTPSATSVPLSWSAPVAGGGSITDYVIQYAAAGTSFASPTTFADGTSTSTAATVTGLAEATAYDFRVAAVNATGTGTYASVLNITTSSTGGAVTANAVTFAGTDFLTSLGNEIYEATTDGTGQYPARGWAGTTLAGDGWIECQFPAATSTSTMMGFNSGGATATPFSQMDFCTQVGSGGTVTHASNSATFSATLTTLSPSPSTRVRIRREGTAVYLETTTDDWATYTLRHTFAASSTGALSAHWFTVFSTTARRICQPRHMGLA